MKKGKVVEIKENFAVVLNEDMAYEKIKKKENLKIGKDIYYFKEDKYIVKSIPFKKYFLVAALFLILFIPPLMNIDKTYGYISLDINPSIQLEVDKNLKTLDIKALNDDGDSIIKKKWIGKDAKVVIENIINETEDKGILNEDRDFVLLSYYLEDEDKTSEEKLIKDFDEIFKSKEKKYEVAIVKSDDKSFEKSKEENTTIGRATLNKKIKENSNDLMEVKEKIKKDKSFKVYQKQKNNKKDKIKEKQDNKKENKIEKKDKSEKKDKFENGNNINKEKLDKKDKTNKNVDKLRDKEKINNKKEKVNPNSKKEKNNNNGNRDKDSKLKENNSNASNGNNKGKDKK
ncbi:MAG: anti-sigma-I factor RsgI family protein [Bacillota bacterium]